MRGPSERDLVKPAPMVTRELEESEAVERELGRRDLARQAREDAKALVRRELSGGADAQQIVGTLARVGWSEEDRTAILQEIVDELEGVGRNGELDALSESGEVERAPASSRVPIPKEIDPRSLRLYEEPDGTVLRPTLEDSGVLVVTGRKPSKRAEQALEKLARMAEGEEEVDLRVADAELLHVYLDSARSFKAGVRVQAASRAGEILRRMAAAKRASLRQENRADEMRDAVRGAPQRPPIPKLP